MHPLERLRLADPETCLWVSERLTKAEPLPPHLLDLVVAETIWALSQEKGLALALAESMIAFIPRAEDTIIDAYIRQVHQASRTGATLARILATHLGPALMAGSAIADKFQNVVTTMQQKGTYVLNAPLELLTELLTRKERSSAVAYLNLLGAVFKQPMSYNQCQRLVHLIPRAVKHFPPQRRQFQIDQLTRIAETRLTLMDAYLEGLEKGLNLLPEQHLIRFVDQALARYCRDPSSGANFLSLTSKLGRDTCADLQVYAPLALVRQQLNRYLAARLEHPVTVQPLSALGTSPRDPGTWVCSNGQGIFIRDEIRRHDCQQRNKDLYMTLTRLEAGFLECDSYSFSLERSVARYASVQQWIQLNGIAPTSGLQCDALQFFQSFSQPLMAEDLFLILELARIFRCMASRYPGLHRRSIAALADEIDRRLGPMRNHPLMPTYLLLVHGHTNTDIPAKPSHDTTARELNQLFKTAVTDQSPVEVCAHILCCFFDKSGKAAQHFAAGYQPIELPLGIRLHWDIFDSALKSHSEKARAIQLRLAEKKLTVNQTELQYQLLKHQGRLDAHDLKALILTRTETTPPQGVQIALSEADLAALAELVDPGTKDLHAQQGDAYVYPEWDYQLNDYLQNYARVQETQVPASGPDSFYQEALSRHQGLVAHIRRAFEFLKPEGLVMLRQWPEGDAFDYRALLDFVVDRRAGRIPSDRLYIKRLKQERDVAVMVLVDLSRSTANPVAGKQTSVLNLTKEALILFCEAMEVVGDAYALAGFSGTGRHSVDYYRIKDFEEPLGQDIRNRISALSPQRSTRMGAAIRHATRRLASLSTAVRLMIVISDGFPNDLAYKADYAIADTRKAVQEARFQSIFVKGVTVNIGRDPRLDDLYGRSHSHVIEDVSGLPEKLLRLYSTLTRPV